MKKSPFERISISILIWLTCMGMVPVLFIMAPVIALEVLDRQLAGHLLMGWLDLLFLAWVGWAVFKRGVRVKWLVGPRPHLWKGALLFAMMPVLIAFTLGSGWISAYYPLASMGPSEFEAFQMHDRGIWYALMVYGGVALLGPVTEELVFRGIMVNRFAHKWGVRPAVLVSSCLFALPHPHVVGAFVFGLTMAVIYVATRSLLLPIAIHVANNAVAVWRGAYGAETGIDILPSGTEAIVVSLMLSVPVLAWYVYRHWPASDAEAPYERNAGLAVFEGRVRFTGGQP